MSPSRHPHIQENTRLKTLDFLFDFLVLSGKLGEHCLRSCTAKTSFLTLLSLCTRINTSKGFDMHKEFRTYRDPSQIRCVIKHFRYIHLTEGVTREGGVPETEELICV